MLSDQFFVKLNEVSKRLGMNPRDLLLCIFLESNGNPASKYKGTGSSARGLLGFIIPTLRNLGASKEEATNFTSFPAEDQLDYVEKLVRSSQRLIGGRPFTSATQYEHANFYPATLGRWRGTDPIANANVVVAAKDAKTEGERQAYRVNSVMDGGKKGYISVGDLTRLLVGVQRRSSFQEALKRLNQVAGQGTVSEFSKIKPKSETSEKPQSSKTSDGLISNLLNYLSKYINIFAQNQDQCLISIGSNDVPAKIEFARVLSLALKEEFGIRSEVRSNNDGVELVCFSNDIETIKRFCSAMTDTFKYATKKIGGVEIITLISSNNSPHYQSLSIRSAEENYEAFHSRFRKDRDGN